MNTMIDVLHEKLIPLAEGLAILPIGKATLSRMTKSGRLETVKVGGRRFSSREAIVRAVEPGPTLDVDSTRTSTPSQIRREAEAVLERLRLRIGGFD